MKKIKMNLDTTKYKLGIWTENECEGCQELKAKLKELKIPFENRGITVPKNKLGNPDRLSPEAQNRWDFMDTDRDNPGVIKYTPVIIVEDVDGNSEYLSAGGAFETTDEAVELLKKYCK